MCEICFIRRKSESTESVADFVTTAGAVGNGTQDLRTRHAVSLLHQQFINPLTKSTLPPANMKETSRSAPVTLFLLGRYPKRILIYKINKNHLHCPIFIE